MVAAMKTGETLSARATGRAGLVKLARRSSKGVLVSTSAMKRALKMKKVCARHVNFFWGGGGVSQLTRLCVVQNKPLVQAGVLASRPQLSTPAECRKRALAEALLEAEAAAAVRHLHGARLVLPVCCARATGCLVCLLLCSRACLYARGLGSSRDVHQ